MGRHPIFGHIDTPRLLHNVPLDLAGRTRESRFEGELQIDGQPLDGESAKQAFAARCAFVQQQDVFLAAGIEWYIK